MSDERTKKHLYTIGLDFGTLSGRALLVDVGDGSVLGESVMDYAHGVMMDKLPSGAPKRSAIGNRSNEGRYISRDRGFI